MKIQWNKVTWYSKIAAVVLGMVIFALGIYIGVVYQKGADALEWSQQLRIDRPSPIQTVTVQEIKKQYEYTQVGTMRNIPPPGSLEEDWWVLVYGDPSTTIVAKRLLFTTSSRCVIDTRVELCNPAIFGQTQRVTVMGHADGDGKIIVERMEVVQ